MEPAAFASAAGILGSVLVIAAYFANLQEWLSSRDWRYSALNLAGALLILLSLFFEWNLPSVVMEGFWALISLVGLWRSARVDVAAREA
ncbi:MAG TPA: cyclic nucleotide-binding protein [Bauldia sp.]|nr:cyclic nucleotide-binding protein [Bauldia sp.]